MRKSILAHKPNKKIFFTVTMVIARYRIRYFFQKSGALANATGKLARYSSSLF